MSLGIFHLVGDCHSFRRKYSFVSKFTTDNLFDKFTCIQSKDSFHAHYRSISYNNELKVLLLLVLLLHMDVESNSGSLSDISSFHWNARSIRTNLDRSNLPRLQHCLLIRNVSRCTHNEFYSTL